jgi:hypothetical protein
MNFELKTFIAMVKFSMYGPLHLSGDKENKPPVNKFISKSTPVHEI